MKIEDYNKRDTEIDEYFRKKYKNCNSTLERVIVDIDYNSAKNKLWNEFTKLFNNKK